jgi:hypothetical protein
MLVNKAYKYEFLKLMKIMKKSSVIIITCISILIFSSCDKNNQLKLPVDLYFQLILNQPDKLNNNLVFNRGSINIENFTFDGVREEGNDVYFSKQFPTGLRISSDSISNTPELYFQIPQGIYNKMLISFETMEFPDSLKVKYSEEFENEDFSIIMEGKYTNALNQVIPVRFEYSLKEYFTIRATDSLENSSIILNTQYPAIGKIIFDPYYWFQTVTDAILNDSEIEDEENPLIMINDELNINIYTIVVNRIKESTKIKIVN